MSSLALARGLSFGDPAIAAISDDVLTFALEQAASRLDEAAWAGQYDRAVCLLALHMATAGPGAPGGGAPGPVSSETVGQWSRAYATMPTPAGEAWLGSTHYGREYLSIRRSRPYTRFLAV